MAEDGFRLFAPYQRGYAEGTRSAGSSGYTFPQFVEDAIAIANALLLIEFDVVGFGMGGTQAWLLAAHQPKRVRSLTSLRFPHPAAFAHGVQFEAAQQEKWRHLQRQLGAATLDETAARLLADGAAGLRHFLQSSGLPQPFLNRYVERLTEPGALVGALAWERAVSIEEFARAPAVSAPTLLLWSEGPALARTSVDATAAYVHAAYRQVLIPAAGNFMLETSSAAVIVPLRDHLRAT